ncbi:hypothetical protein [Thiothrix nivea]|uniref:hypothetical protein n=1 Tax=Thiothrix nivea TaxID=1031 RepID=UPI000592C307|nr:hypothetical protein [Thiothrix nivea]
MIFKEIQLFAIVQNECNLLLKSMDYMILDRELLTFACFRIAMKNGLTAVLQNNLTYSGQAQGLTAPQQ